MPTFGWVGSVLIVMIGGAHSRFCGACHAYLVTRRAHGHGARRWDERTWVLEMGAFAAISAARAVAAGAFGAHCARSEEGRVGKSVALRVYLAGLRIIKKQNPISV